jgi:effector-binding domain-containing protein
MRYLFLILVTLMSSQLASAYERAFPKTNVGTIEIKTVPAAQLLVAHGEGNYFDENNNLFRPLFRYIQANDISMTTPVEAEISPGTMYFYVGTERADKKLESTDEVSVIQLPERTVLSLGVRGRYNAENFNEAEKTLTDHLAKLDDWVQAGPPRAIYWNGPFTLGFLKRSEVHIPIKSNQ